MIVISVISTSAKMFRSKKKFNRNLNEMVRLVFVMTIQKLDTFYTVSKVFQGKSLSRLVLSKAECRRNFLTISIDCSSCSKNNCKGKGSWVGYHSFSSIFKPLSTKPHKMLKHTQTIRWQLFMLIILSKVTNNVIETVICMK